jgi:hypothetical protein
LVRPETVHVQTRHNIDLSIFGELHVADGETQFSRYVHRANIVDRFRNDVGSGDSVPGIAGFHEKAAIGAPYIQKAGRRRTMPLKQAKNTAKHM